MSADRSGGRGDRDPAARFLPECHLHLVDRQLERLGDVIADPDRERLAEMRLVPEADQVELERLRLEAECPGRYSIVAT